jgi:DNA-binding response OmpR family regulator
MSSLSPPYFWGARVLVVECDRARRERVVEGLINFGFMAFGAQSNGEALSFIDQEMDIVAFDLSMFGGGGVDLIDEWKRRKGNTKILVCGFEPKQEHLDIVRRGANIAIGGLMGLKQVSWLVDDIRRTLNEDLEDIDRRAKELAPGYTLESAKSLMEQGEQEHEKGKLTWAADAWELADRKWKEKLDRRLKRLGRKYGPGR